VKHPTETFLHLGHAGGSGIPSRCRMRDLWDEHVQYTRMAIVAFANGLPELDATVARLQQNQDALGAFFGERLGAAVGQKVAALLHEHIDGAVALLKAAKSGSGFEQAYGAWRQNGIEIADALASTGFWSQQALREAMLKHLETTVAEADAEIKGRWAESVAAYDVAREHALMMARVFSDGLSL